MCLSRGEDDCERMIESDDYLRSLAPFITVLHTPPETKRISSTAVRRLMVKTQNLEKEISALVPKEILLLLQEQEGTP